MAGHLISLMIALPFFGAILQALLPPVGGKNSSGSVTRWAALLSSLAASLCGIVLVGSMRQQVPDFQVSETFAWIGSYAISYDVAIDGLNALLVLLISIVFPLLIAAESNRKSGLRGIQALLLVLQASLMGAVCAQDLFLIFFFWTLSSLPIFFMIGIWGGEGREKAAIQTMITSAIGNAFLFAALILIYYSIDPHTFSLRELAGGKLAGKTFQILESEFSVSNVAFAFFGIGLAFRIPIWPIHGWFTQVAREAPPSAFVALGAVTVPVGMYIFVRTTYTLFPETVAQMAHTVAMIGAVNLVMGGICAVAQRGLTMLLAFVCLGEVGALLIGIGSLSSAGVVGSIFQALVLGLGVAGFGLFAGIISDRTGKTVFKDEDGKVAIGGIASQAPMIAVVAGVMIASLLGIPGFGGFVGRSLLMIGSFSVHPVVVLFGGLAFLLATYYLFGMYRTVFFGKAVSEKSSDFMDLTAWEKAYLVPLVVSLVLLGLYPKFLIELVRPTALTLLSTIK
ncbi:NADH-quinone oxidoreductase subunit M [bacterium]|jgi:NADH-quinone oxidoreductase subunit M|nr:NADH-quinone oxidoreductase subunit M [bacterium]